MPEPDLIMKRNDTWPPLQAVLSDDNGVIDLTDATAVLLLLKGKTTLVDGACVVADDPTTGAVTYLWATDDLSVADSYDVEFQITWTGGAIETVPNGGYNSIEIIADLGP